MAGKKFISILILLLTVSFLECGSEEVSTRDNKEGGVPAIEGAISISGAWALYPMAVRWAEEFRKRYPGATINISAGGAGKGMSDVLSGIVDIGMVSREIYDTEIERGAYGIAVVKDAVVPTINESNPFIDAVLAKGMKKQAFIDIWVTGKVAGWSEVFPGVLRPGRTIVNVYTRSDACGAAKTWAKYLGYQQEDLAGVGVYGDPGLAEAVIRDPLGIGYNNINFAYDGRTKKPVRGLKVIPIEFTIILLSLAFERICRI